MTDKSNYDLVLLLSGGLDSTVLAHFAKRSNLTAMALLIDYGQKHVRELEKAAAVCRELQMHYRPFEVRLPGVVSALTDGGLPGTYENVSEWHVPGRNIIFVGLAAALAEAIGARKIWYGANYDDRINQFPDCYQEWIVSMNRVLQHSGSYPIELEAPLLGMRKPTIEAWARLFGIDADEVHSGYEV